MDGEQDGATPPGGDDFARRVVRVGALAEPVRRRLYQYVVAQDEPVSRDQAAAATDVALHTAKFHLDRLVTEGLLETRSRRLTGRSGPGAGRPSKLYLRTADEVAVSLPERRYDLAGRLMARAIDRSATHGEPVREVLDEVAAAYGRSIGRAAPGPEKDPLARACDVLEDLGYEPRRAGGDVVLTNCPFHALVADHTALVCGMNLALLGAVGDELGPDGPTARLDPAPGRCCVVLSPR